MLHIIYESSDGVTVDWAADDHVRLGEFEVSENAEEGTVAQSTLMVEDIGGALDIVGLKNWWAYETACQDGDKIIASGHIGDREIGRDVGGDELQVLGSDRWWNTGLVDKEAILSRRIITGSDGDRPAETDIARLLWLIGSDYVEKVSNTLGYIDTTHPVSLDKADLRGQSAYQVLSDCANNSNKNFFLVKSAESVTTGIADYSLFYAYNYDAQYASTLQLTNVRADVDNSTTFAVDPDMRLRRTPERIYSGVLVHFTNGSVYQQKTATGNAFAFRDTTHISGNVKTVAQASTKATRYLNDADTEEDRITCRFTVPKEQVNDLRAGQTVSVKFSYLPGYSDAYTTVRCIRRTVRQISPDFYELNVELTPGNGSGSEATTSTMQLQAPNDNNYGGSGAATFRVNWDNDGDDAASGCSVSASAGLMTYLGAASERTGIQIDGDGQVTVDYHGTISGVGNNTVTLTAFVNLNGATVMTTSQTTSGGLRGLAWTWDLSDQVIPVREGDVIEGWFTIAGDVPTLVIPAGVGDCANMLFVRGTLK